MGVSEPGTDAPTARPRLVTPTFLLVTVATFAYFLSIGIVIPVLPVYVSGPLDGTDLSVGIAVGAFSLSALLLRPWAGRVGDRRGRRLLLVAGALLVTGSTAGYLIASSLPALVALRLVAGAGEALFFVGAASIVHDVAPDDRRGEAASLFSLALWGSLAVGPLLGESLLGVDRFGAVWVVAAASALAASIIAARMPETRPDGAAEHVGRILHPGGLRPGLIVALGIWGFAGFEAFVPLYARSLGLDGADMVFVVLAVIILSVRSLGARLPDRLGFVRSARFALMGSALGLATMGLWGRPAGLFVGTAIFAFGQSLMFPALMSLAVSRAPAAERGGVVGTFTAFVDLAFGAGALTLGGIAAAVGYAGTFLAAGALSVLGMVILAGLRDTGRERIDLAGIADPAP